MKDRDVYTAKHPTPSPGVPAFIDEEITSQYAGEELRALRRKRPTDERIARLEDKHDKLDGKVDGIAERAARMEGKLDTALSLIVPEQGKTARAHIDSRTKIIIAVVGAIGTALGIVITALSGCS
jgi:hypothetical protein